MQGSLWEMVAGSRASLLHQQQLLPSMFVAISLGHTPMYLTLLQMSEATLLMFASQWMETSQRVPT
ncbi:hypothetical protein MT325_m154R [Paramecium bursaria chlorella virus MT325]|uniref:Uncharacterized protein m154R n=1 Tax=Paramecium bursaria Chlorella virus MT325 TaxID=346932 RepID=A7ITN4_PBCVM|nr:hypothetical protein MT325_m154R [Paramecium bursaria chlorella virus MT325]